MAVDRPKETSFVRTDHHLDVPIVPPLATEIRIRPVSLELGPTEVLVPRRSLDQHGFGRVDTGFAQFQRNQTVIAAVVVSLCVLLVGGGCFMTVLVVAVVAGGLA